MKILVLNGSPHKSGNTAALVDAFKMGAYFRNDVLEIKGALWDIDDKNQFTQSLDQIEEAQKAGLTMEQIIIDPGFGFAKTREQNYRLLAHCSEFKTLGARMLIGLSHKKFLSQPNEKPPKRKTQTLCANFAALCAGADILRVHDARETQKVLSFFNELEANS